MVTPDPEWLAKLEEIRARHNRQQRYLLWIGESIVLALTVLIFQVQGQAWIGMLGIGNLALAMCVAILSQQFEMRKNACCCWFVMLV